jgi:hypothetical protein
MTVLGKIWVRLELAAFISSSSPVVLENPRNDELVAGEWQWPLPSMISGSSESATPILARVSLSNASFEIS